MLVRAVLPMALSLVAAMGPTPANAEPEHVHIQFSAAPGCPDRAAFIRAVRARTLRFQLAGSAEQARSFAVTIAQTDARVSGRLAITSPAAAPSLRSITGRTCNEVVAVLAFMTALAIDPSASPDASPSRMPPAAASPAAKNPVPETPAPAVAPASAATRVTRAAEAAEPAAPAPPATRPAAPAQERRGPEDPEPEPTPALASPSLVAKRAGGSASHGAWAWSAGLHGGTSVGLSPTPGLGGLLFVEAAAPGPALWGPVLRLGLFLHHSDTSLANDATAELQWAALMLEGCPLRLVALDARLALHACLAGHVGVLRVRSQRLEQPARTTDAWADLGPAARLRVAIAADLFVEVQGMLVLPLRRLTYDVYYEGATRPPTSVFTVAHLGALAGIGVAYQFR